MTNHPAFSLIHRQSIDSLNLDVEHYRHNVTGADHYHLVSDDPQNVFMVALRTVPMDSTGVAHILEHTVLCGSEKFPVRDPFFMMIRRSLNTFMNALTASDWTAYPFATENRKDFDNLLQVYLDAVFFPQIDPLDFAQEGHRLEFETQDDPISDLTYKGVVYNEMKGAMSSPVATLFQKVTEELYPTGTYHYNSGGDPADIPKLTHAQMKAFHQTHYHPSNAVFLTYGDIPAADHQAKFEDLALSRFDQSIGKTLVGKTERLSAPKSVESTYALNEDDLSNKTHIVLSWLLGENQDPMAVLKGHLLSSVLLDNSASPLRQALEACEWATAPSPLCGFEDGNKEMAFAAGVQGSEPEHADKVEALILETLEKVAKDGVPQADVEAMLHQLELAQREVGGDGFPYGLQLIMQALPGALHEGDPIALLDVDEALLQLRKDIENPRFIPDLIQSWILDNPHRVRLTMKPDPEQADREAAAEKARLASTQAELTEAEKTAIIEQAQALQARQDEDDDPSLLPEVTKNDVPETLKQIDPVHRASTEVPYQTYEAGTNGLTYLQMVMDLPELTDSERALMPLFNTCLTEVGAAGRDYLQNQALQAAVTGGLGAKSTLKADLDDPAGFHSHFVLSGKALNAHQHALSDLMFETLAHPRFDESDRIKDLVGQIRASVEQSVTNSGHALAMMAANQNHSAVANWQFQRSGFAGIQAIKQLSDGLDEAQGLERMQSGFADIQHKLMQTAKQALIISDADGLPSALSSTQGWDTLFEQKHPAHGLSLSVENNQIHQAWVTSTQVNFCAQSYPAVMAGHADAPALSVLGAMLRNGFLHTAVREKGGAYGGGATYNPEAGSFAFFSYRDPRVLETYADFEHSLDWVLGDQATQAKVDEAILNVISAIDKPGSPAGEARKAFYYELYGRTHALRTAHRQAILDTTLDDVRRVAATYLKPENASRAVLTNAENGQILTDHGFEVHTL
ncbi:insulinase family protein [Thiomicrospira sp. WB1]|uniref:insulinase family protein n=1 Tax=Thiomicrospira sp. WB1 TaxID=1685380 RepID=UPI000748FB22|nr:insulinase family protein [Thiomicrospira sp. WB1]KUJ71982.1 peptidase M16 [Thiomicrospira sp. WB1]